MENVIANVDIYSEEEKGRVMEILRFQMRKYQYLQQV